MSPNQRVWGATAIAMTICALIFFTQRESKRTVRSEIERLEQVIASSPTPAAPAEKIPAADATNASTRESPPAAELVAMLPDGQRDPAESFRGFAAMLERIRHYSTDEILTLIEDLDQLAKSEASQAQKVGFPRMMLMVIAADDAPERILEMAQDANDEVRSAAFAGLVKKDPQRARAYLEEVEWPAREVQLGKAALFAEWLQRDVSVALDLFRDGSWTPNPESAAAIGDACSDPETRKEVWRAAREEDDAAVRLQLSKGLFIGELMRGGAKGLRRAFADADFLDAKLKAELVREFSGQSMAAEPDETTAWIREAVPPEDVSTALAGAVGSWARRDFNAAGTWLGEQAPSPERDQAIASFAATVVGVDPAAAATWAEEITDPALRERTLKKALEKWKANDPTAAEAWLRKQE